MYENSLAFSSPQTRSFFIPISLWFLASLAAFVSSSSDSLIVSDIPAPRGYWQNGTVPYIIDPSFTAEQRSVIKQQLEKLGRNVPCNSLRIRIWSPADKDVVYIQKSDSPVICASDGMGRLGGEQGLFLGSSCFEPARQGEILAQFMRILGFPNEHQRPDRDQYIQVFYSAISIAHRREYYKYSDWLPGWKSTDPYDFESVTHFPDDMFAYGTQLRTFKPWEAQEKSIGMRQKLSRFDKVRLQRLFPCAQQQQSQSIAVSQPQPLLLLQSVLPQPPQQQVEDQQVVLPLTQQKVVLPPATTTTTTTVKPKLPSLAELLLAFDKVQEIAASNRKVLART